MKVTVDPVACEANAVCVRLVPQVFSIHEDDDGEDVLAIANDGEVPAELRGRRPRRGNPLPQDGPDAR